jgi:membrane protease subunit HflK
VLVDAKSNNTIYLPIDKMMAQASTNDAAVGSKSGPVQAPQQQGQQQAQPQAQQQQAAPPPEVQQTIETVRQRDARSRESQRDRETR